jgi:hypothetical protein
MLSVRVSMEFHAYETVSNAFHSTLLLFLSIFVILLFFINVSLI